MSGWLRTTIRTVDPTRRASTCMPLGLIVPSTLGVPERSTSTYCGPLGANIRLTIAPSPNPNPPPSNITSARSPLISRFPAMPRSCSSLIKVRDAVTFLVTASMIFSLPWLTVMTRFPSVFTRSGSSTPASWTLVVECSGAASEEDFSTAPLAIASTAKAIGPPRPHELTFLAVCSRSPASMSSQPL